MLRDEGTSPEAWSRCVWRRRRCRGGWRPGATPFVKVQAATRWSIPMGSAGAEHVATSEDFTGLIWHGTGELVPAGGDPFSTKLNP